MANDKIAIFPASGKLGGSLMGHIFQLIPFSNVVLIARFPSKLHHYQASGANIRTADYDEPETLQSAFEGVKILFLISRATFEHELRSKAHKLAIDCALQSGVKHIFYTSLAFGGGVDSHGSLAHVMQAHLDTEKYLSNLSNSDPSFTYTCIREGLYSESFPIYTAFFNLKNPSTLEIRIPHDGERPGIAWAKIDELGEASASLLARYYHSPDEFQYKNRLILLSGPREWSLQETAEVISRVLGKEVTICQVSVEEYVAQPQVDAGLTVKGRNMGREWASAYDAIRNGETSVVTPMLREILGREPEDFETTIRKMATSM